MTTTHDPDAALRNSIRPRIFCSSASHTDSNDVYVRETTIRNLLDFFEAKGLRGVKEEDAREQWYADWIEHQAAHRVYAGVLSPAQYSNFGFHFDSLRYARFLEVFAYFSPAHGYSLQCTFLGLFSIL